VNPHWISLIGALLFGVLGQLLLKSGAVAGGSVLEQVLRPITLAGLVFYGGAAFLYLIALRGIPVSVAFPSAAAQYVVVAVVGWLVWAEPVGLQQIGGLALIICGVLLLATA
jgi:multidrug transporter EmrE-like cation transporter